MGPIDYQVAEGVAILTIEHPPVNALSAQVRVALGAALAIAVADDTVRAIVLIGGGSTFVAGADIGEFGTPASKCRPLLSELQRTLERCPKLVVAAIHGAALGGGLELALACAARVAVVGAKVGLPEVDLGILPGAGGTQRLTRLVGPDAAIDIMTSGRHLPARDALELGIIDAIVAELRSDAVAFAQDALDQRRIFTAVIDRADKNLAPGPAMLKAARTAAAKKRRGQIAPIAIIDCVEAACRLDADEGLAFEKRQFQKLYEGEQRKALTYCFHAERQARKIPGLVDVAALPIERVAVIGAGMMGGGIAMVFANSGMPVTLLDIDADALARGRAAIEKNYQIAVGRGAMAAAGADAALSIISSATRYEALGDKDLIVEAVYENMALKRDIFAQLDRHAAPHAILGTNTSSLDVDAIAAATARPEKVIGTHFFAPANLMKLLEIVRGAGSSPETIRTVMELGKRIGKVVALAGNCDGFIGNRMLQYYSANSEFLLEQGATPDQIDRVAIAFGMPMGSPSLRDLTGLDSGLRVRKAREKTLPPGERFSPILQRLVEAGRLGRKNGKGFYRYDGREKVADPEVADIIAGVARDLGIRQRVFSDEEVRDRLFMPLVNEGAKELEDGTALRAGDIDVVWVNGYNFPAHRGGPMFWGEQIGLDRVHAMAERLGAENGPRWKPGPLLTRLAREGKGWKDA